MSPPENPEGASPSPPEKPGPIPREAIQAAAAAYYTRAASLADAARQRAQTAFTMASAIAAALAAGGAFANIGKEPTHVQVVGFCAFAAWLATAFLLLRAAVSEHTSDNAPKADGKDLVERDGLLLARGDAAFIRILYDEVEGERDAVYNRLRGALSAALLALVLTGAAIGLALLGNESAPASKSKVVSAQVSLKTVPKPLVWRCPGLADHSGTGRLDTAELAKTFTRVAFRASQCRRKATTVELPTADIADVEVLGR